MDLIHTNKYTGQQFSIKIDEEDLDVYEKHRWTFNIRYKYLNSVIQHGMYQISYIYLHKEILKKHGYIILKGFDVDHINRDKTDNRKCNLRVVSKSQNVYNRPKFSLKASSKYKGVNFHKRVKAFAVTVGYKNKSISLGYYENEEYAAYAYNVAASILFKDFAYLNVLPEIDTQIKTEITKKIMDKLNTKLKSL